MNKLAAIYTRVSTKAQAKKHGLAAQLVECEAYAEREGLQVGKHYSELGVSGQLVGRPEIQRAIEDAQSGLFTDLIFDNWDRLGRSVETTKDLERELTDAGVTLHPVRGGGEYDPDDDSQWLDRAEQAHPGIH